ncbi:MAG: DUF1499 domain-containing protein [Oleiphilaceae bacterium]|nr:DUF1499 domain-containing protein [Oleiphilaceae bacterium]
MFSFRPKQTGVLKGRLAPCPASPNCVSSQAESGRCQVEPLFFSGPPEEAMTRLKAIVERMPRTTLTVEKESYLHFECASKWFGFVDDLEFLCHPDSHRIDVRSASRLGYSDMGMNRKRTEVIRKEFNA